MSTGIELEVCRDISDRQQKGLTKYGVTVADNPTKIRGWLRHAYEECLDQAIYLKRAMQEMDNRNSNNVPQRVTELCERLTSAGSIHLKLSASELHEICDFIFELNQKDP